MHCLGLKEMVGSRLDGKHYTRAHIEDGYQLQIFVAYGQTELCQIVQFD